MPSALANMAPSWGRGMAKPLSIVGAAALACALALSPDCAPGAHAHQAESAQQIFLFQYSPGPAWRAGVPIERQALGPHAAYMQRLKDEGHLFAGGPYLNAEGGMAIVTAANLDEARAILAADPAITSGVFVADLRQWRPRFRTDQPLPLGG